MKCKIGLGVDFMHYVETVLKTVDFIESNLNKKLSMDEMAQYVSYSPFHLIRLFHLVVGDTPGNYLRKRRLTEAAKILKKQQVKVIDIAFDFQFESSEAFSRAFKSYFNVTPMTCKTNDHHIQLFYKNKITPENLLKIKRIYVEPKFETLNDMNLVGIIYYGKNEDGEIPEMWGRHYTKLESLKNRVDKNTTYGFCFHHEDYKDFGQFNYLISQEVYDLGDIPMSMVAKRIPRTDYAVFTVSDENLGDTYQFIYGEYLPKQSFKDDESFNFEKYTTLEDGSTEIKIYIAIKK